MTKLLIFDAFMLLIREKNVANYVLLRCKTFSLKIWLCRILDKYHILVPDLSSSTIAIAWVWVVLKEPSWLCHFPSQVGSFAPVLSKTVAPHTLILGTMPSNASHANVQYYGHPRLVLRYNNYPISLFQSYRSSSSNIHYDVTSFSYQYFKSHTSFIMTIQSQQWSQI